MILVYKSGTAMQNGGYVGKVIIWHNRRAIGSIYCTQLRFTRDEALDDARSTARLMREAA